MMIKSQLFIGAALLAGVAIGYFVKEPSAQPESAVSAEAPAAKKAVADKGAEATIAALRHRVAELEKLLAEQGEKSETAVPVAAAEEARERSPEPPRGNWRERMEEMRKNEPERYAQMTNRYAQWRQNRSEQARSKIGFLSSVDTSRMSAGAKKTHAALQELIARREELEAQMQQPELGDEERGQIMRELWESHGELQRLNREERKILIDETAKSLGFEGNDAKEVAATIREVIEATDGGFGFQHRGGRHGPPSGGPRGR